jgi:hypothetical protein
VLPKLSITAANTSLVFAIRRRHLQVLLILRLLLLLIRWMSNPLLRLPMILWLLAQILLNSANDRRKNAIVVPKLSITAVNTSLVYAIKRMHLQILLMPWLLLLLIWQTTAPLLRLLMIPWLGMIITLLLLLLSSRFFI